MALNNLIACRVVIDAVPLLAKNCIATVVLLLFLRLYEIYRQDFDFIGNKRIF